MSIINIQNVKKILREKAGFEDFLFYHYHSADLKKQIELFKINAFTATLCVAGTIDINIGLSRYTIQRNDMLVMLPSHMIQINSISSDFEANIIMVADKFIDKIDLDTGQILETYFIIDKNPKMQLKPGEELNMVKTFYLTIKKVITLFGFINNKEIAQHLVYSFLLSITSLYLKHLWIEPSFSDPNNLVGRFLILLRDHSRQHRAVHFYADQLCITPKYLSTVIKRTTNKTAGEWITDTMIHESKVLLRKTNLSIQQISEKLNFPNQSSFGKFFKKQTGISPKNYRNNLK